MTALAMRAPVAALAAALALAGCGWGGNGGGNGGGDLQAPAALSAPAARLADDFRAAAFARPAAGGAPQGPATLLRWDGAIPWGFDSTLPNGGDDAALVALVAASGRAAGRAMTRTPDLADGGIRLWVTAAAEIERTAGAPGARCHGMLGTVRKGPRQGAPIAVAMAAEDAPPSWRRECLAMSLVTALGLAGARSVDAPLVEGGEAPALTPLGATLLRILYDPRLGPGMTEAEAMPVVRAIAAEIAP